MEVKASRATEVTAKGATNGNRNGKGATEENTNGATASDSQDEQAVTCFESFDDMQLAEVSQGPVSRRAPCFRRPRRLQGLLRGIYAYGFERPSLIQQRAIVPMTQGRDIIAQSQSGTGCTASPRPCLAITVCSVRRRNSCRAPCCRCRENGNFQHWFAARNRHICPHLPGDRTGTHT